MIKFIIFSKDRPAQLDFLLRTIQEYYPECRYKVIYKATTDEYEQGYKLLNEHIQKQVNFKNDVLSSMDSRYTCFLVDDMAFIDTFKAAGWEFYEFATNENILCLSLRLYPGITYSYTKDMEIKSPFNKDHTGLNIWHWQTKESYWGYPMSLDGHIFRTKDIKPMIEVLDFNNPNELEGELAMNPMNKPLMICYDRAKVVNYPLNVVQDVCDNNHMNVSVELLNESFIAGHRLNIKCPENHNSCHMAVYPEWL